MSEQPKPPGVRPAIVIPEEVKSAKQSAAEQHMFGYPSLQQVTLTAAELGEELAKQIQAELAQAYIGPVYALRQLGPQWRLVLTLEYKP